ncbi:hypothetical protein [Streptomyces venezuelae]|nr:hypothetical protein [Streptomyces venezuelae]
MASLAAAPPFRPRDNRPRTAYAGIDGLASPLAVPRREGNAA